MAWRHHMSECGRIRFVDQAEFDFQYDMTPVQERIVRVVDGDRLALWSWDKDEFIAIADLT